MTQLFDDVLFINYIRAKGREQKAEISDKKKETRSKDLRT
jgi:hypothetical protein